MVVGVIVERARYWQYRPLVLQVSLQIVLSFGLVDLSPNYLPLYPRRLRVRELVGGWTAILGYYFSHLPEQLRLRMVMVWLQHGYDLRRKLISGQ